MQAVEETGSVVVSGALTAERHARAMDLVRADLEQIQSFSPQARARFRHGYYDWHVQRYGDPLRSLMVPPTPVPRATMPNRQKPS